MWKRRQRQRASRRILDHRRQNSSTWPLRHSAPTNARNYDDDDFINRSHQKWRFSDLLDAAPHHSFIRYLFIGTSSCRLDVSNFQFQFLRSPPIAKSNWLADGLPKVRTNMWVLPLLLRRIQDVLPPTSLPFDAPFPPPCHSKFIWPARVCVHLFHQYVTIRYFLKK